MSLAVKVFAASTVLTMVKHVPYFVCVCRRARNPQHLLA
jgi:hypothetical protein